MKYVNSGAGKLPLITLVAILSISLTVNLPGLAISPIMGKLQSIFPSASEFEIQLLTVLPNLVIIPFMLLSGKLSVRHSPSMLAGIGLGIYLLAGVLYFFSDTMKGLILISALLGAGCGIVVPLAGGLIGQYFVGAQRVKYLGVKSGVSNFTIILGTLFVGLVAGHDWHLPFAVYMMPIIPLCLISFMTSKYISAHKVAPTSTPPYEPLAEPKITPADPRVKAEKPTDVNFHFTGKRSLVLLLGVILIYFTATYSTEVVSYYLPFTFKHYGLSTGDTGDATSLYFLACTLAGFLLPKTIRLVGRDVMTIGAVAVMAALYMTGFVHHYGGYLVAVALMGFAYGTIQPIIYDKATYLAPTAQESTKYFSYVLAANYVGISLTPVIVSGVGKLLHTQADTDFSYMLNGTVMLLLIIWMLWKRKTFSVEVDPKLYR
ncbi:MAG: MFS transporter [Muribaculaceae bacterium]|nr:MFS transporter [Muribaculaceae bacterium]